MCCLVLILEVLWWCPGRGWSNWCACVEVEIEAEVTLRLTVSQSVSMSWCRAPLWGPWPDFTFFFLLPENCFALRLGNTLWREDGSVICSAICQWSESRRTHNHTLLSHLRLPSSLSIAPYNSQRLRWKYSYSPTLRFRVRASLRLTVSHSVSMSWCRAHFVDVWPDIASWVWNLLSCLCGVPSLTRGRVCPL
jgi:hypothetical protein